jgi:hypothetical protein
MQFLFFFLSNNIWAKRMILVLRSILLSRRIEIIYNLTISRGTRLCYFMKDASKMIFEGKKTSSSK